LRVVRVAMQPQLWACFPIIEELIYLWSKVALISSERKNYMFGFGEKKEQKAAATQTQGKAREIVEAQLGPMEQMLAAGNVQGIPAAHLPLMLAVAQDIPDNADIVARINKIAKAKGVTVTMG